MNNKYAQPVSSYPQAAQRWGGGGGFTKTTRTTQEPKGAQLSAAQKAILREFLVSGVVFGVGLDAENEQWISVGLSGSGWSDGWESRLGWARGGTHLYWGSVRTLFFCFLQVSLSLFPFRGSNTVSPQLKGMFFFSTKTVLVLPVSIARNGQ